MDRKQISLPESTVRRFSPVDDDDPVIPEIPPDQIYESVMSNGYEYNLEEIVEESYDSGVLGEEEQPAEIPMTIRVSKSKSITSFASQVRSFRADKIVAPAPELLSEQIFHSTRDWDNIALVRGRTQSNRELPVIPEVSDNSEDDQPEDGGLLRPSDVLDFRERTLSH